MGYALPRAFDDVLYRAEGFDVSPVTTRYRADRKLDARTAELHERELKRFLAMCSYKPGSYAMAGPIDDLWHCFLLFTRRYGEFCAALGGPFIHHTPLVEEEAAGVIADHGRYAVFLNDYRHLIGEPPAEAWPELSVASCSDSAIRLSWLGDEARKL